MSRGGDYIFTDSNGTHVEWNIRDGMNATYLAPPQFPYTVWNCSANGWGNPTCKESILRNNYPDNSFGASLPYGSGGRCVMRQDEMGGIRYVCSALSNVMRSPPPAIGRRR